MRYQNWDVLIFPGHTKVPLQEFKTDCHVIHDSESHSVQSNPQLLPIVTCFIPGLPDRAPFHVSVHSWEAPQISRHLRNIRKPSDISMFEARTFIDGTLVGSKWFSPDSPWPTIFDLGMDVDKNGEFQKLTFPTFHKELLSQSYWNAGDDLGRIKVIIAEGFSRDNIIYPFERVKNIVCFSFQHAPLDVLETSQIAWPNTAMWRQVSLLGPYFAQQCSPRRIDDRVEGHGHSPRHKTIAPQSCDPFTGPGRSGLAIWRQSSSADVSMPDYSASNTRTNSSRHVTDPMSVSGLSDHRLEPLQHPGAYDTICEALMPSAPTNTPQNEYATVKQSIEVATATTTPMTQRHLSEIETAGISASKHANPIAGADINPAVGLGTSDIGGIKGRKENMQENVQEDMQQTPGGIQENVKGSGGGARKISQSFAPAKTTSESPHATEVDPNGSEGRVRKASQSYLPSDSGSKKRQRIASAASKLIDDEDELKSSPSLRKVSGQSFNQGVKEGERRVLSGIENK